MKGFIERVERGWIGSGLISGVMFTSRSRETFSANDGPIVDSPGHTVGAYDPKERVWVTIVDSSNPSKTWETACARTEIFEQALREAGRAPIRVDRLKLSTFARHGYTGLVAHMIGAQS